MAMRMTGLMSGMDTESIIQELVSAKRVKVDKEKKAQTKLEWKQDAWKELNTKLKNFQQKYLSAMRFSDAYSKKTTKVSNSNAVSVITGENAVNGVQNLRIDQLAKTAYMTGREISDADGNDLTALSKLSDIDSSLFSAGDELAIEVNGKAIKIEAGADATISDVLKALKEGGLNASFDAKWQRFNISAKESGEDGNFEIKILSGPTGSMTENQGALEALGLYVPSDAVIQGIKDRTDLTDAQKQEALEAEYAKSAYLTKGQDAIIYLNGAEYKHSNNTFEINGLTLTALNTTQPGEEITVTTERDTDGIYDMIKNLFKEYNELVNEMDKLYNADSAKGYEPLTDDEKDAMSDKEIEKWEQKVKDSILRRDDNLSSVNSTLQEIMAGGVEVNGKTMYLFDFGIEMPGYFESADGEKHAYHIFGDPDDTYSMNKDDVLKGMISSDPDTVISFFSELSRKLYDKMSDMSKSVNGYRSFGNFYDDKKMKTDYDSYTSKIKEMEAKVTAYENKWYAKFSKMETALAKMQSNASAITGLLGG